MIRLIMLLFFSAVVLIFPTCAFSQKEIFSARAKVYEGVPEAADGCGVMVVIDSIEYKAEGIPKEYIKDGLEVILKYRPGETFYCGRGMAPIETIEVISIQTMKNRKNRCKKHLNK